MDRLLLYIQYSSYLLFNMILILLYHYIILNNNQFLYLIFFCSGMLIFLFLIRKFKRHKDFTDYYLK